MAKAGLHVRGQAIYSVSSADEVMVAAALVALVGVGFRFLAAWIKKVVLILNPPRKRRQRT